MRVVITGGTGFIGSRLVSLLVASGYQVVVATRNPDRGWSGPEQGVTMCGLEGASLQQAVDGALGVVNLAGYSVGSGRWTKVRKERIISSRIETTQHVASAIAGASRKPEVLIQGSAVGFYGSRGDEILTEESEQGQGFLASVVSSWEHEAKRVESDGVRVVFARTSMVLGTAGGSVVGALAQFLPPFRFFVGGPLGSGTQWMSWIHVEDEVRAILHLMQSTKASGVYNLAAPSPVSMSAFCKTLGKTLGRPSWLPVPTFALRLILGEMADELVLTSQRIRPDRLLESGFSFTYPQVEEALRAVLASATGK